MDSRIVDSGSDIKTIYKGIKNAWKWQWLEKCVEGDMISKHIRKLNVAGIVRCILSAKDISYRIGAFKSIHHHTSKKIHTSKSKTKIFSSIAPAPQWSNKVAPIPLNFRFIPNTITKILICIHKLKMQSTSLNYESGGGGTDIAGETYHSCFYSFSFLSYRTNCFGIGKPLETELCCELYQSWTVLCGLEGRIW